MDERAAGASTEQFRTVSASAHAQLGTTLAQRYVGRVAPQRMIHLYCAALGVSERDSQWLKAHVLRTGLQRHHEAQVREARHGVLRFRDWLRVNAAPHGNAPLSRSIESDLARCRELVEGLEARRDAGAATRSRRSNETQPWRVRLDNAASLRHDRQLAAGSRKALITATGTRRVSEGRA